MSGESRSCKSLIRSLFYGAGQAQVRLSKMLQKNVTNGPDPSVTKTSHLEYFSKDFSVFIITQIFLCPIDDCRSADHNYKSRSCFFFASNSSCVIIPASSNFLNFIISSAVDTTIRVALCWFFNVFLCFSIKSTICLANSKF